MSLPSFQFYPGDWLKDLNLRACSHAARGAWVDALCFLHQSASYGQFVLGDYVMTPQDIAQAISCPRELVSELFEKGVLKRSARRKIMFSARMVRDELRRRRFNRRQGRWRHGKRTKSGRGAHVDADVDGSVGADVDADVGAGETAMTHHPSSSSSSSSSEPVHTGPVRFKKSAARTTPGSYEPERNGFEVGLRTGPDRAEQTGWELREAFEQWVSGLAHEAKSPRARRDQVWVQSFALRVAAAFCWSPESWGQQVRPVLAIARKLTAREDRDAVAKELVAMAVEKSRDVTLQKPAAAWQAAASEIARW